MYRCENGADLQDGIGGLGNQELQNNTKVSGSGLGEEGKGPKSPRHGGVGRGARPHECGGMPRPSRHPITPEGLDSLHDTPLNDSNWKTWDCGCLAKCSRSVLVNNRFAQQLRFWVQMQ